MTAQILDRVNYQGNNFSLSNFTDEIPFNPSNYDIVPSVGFSACWRGFIRVFNVVGDELFISYLTASDSRKNIAPNKPVINGVTPEYDEGNYFNKTYENIDLKVNYSGTFLIARDPVSELFSKSGYPLPWLHRTVLELTFDQGNLTQEEDISPFAEKIRKKAYKELEENPNSRFLGFHVDEWIYDSRNQKYSKGK